MFGSSLAVQGSRSTPLQVYVSRAVEEDECEFGQRNVIDQVGTAKAATHSVDNLEAGPARDLLLQMTARLRVG